MSFSQNRIDSLKSAISDQGARAMAVRDTHDIEWLTGFEHVFDEERAHVALVSNASDKLLFHTDSRYIDAALKVANGTDVEVDANGKTSIEWIHENAISNGVALNGADLAIEDSISLFEYRALQKAFAGDKEPSSNAKFIETHDTILNLRAVKDDLEIKKLISAQAVTDKAFEHIVEFMRAGMTERQIQLELDDYMLENGADGLAFPSIVASGANGASPHAIVSDKIVEEGECVVMDFGAKKDGYCSDMTRTVFVGQPSAELLYAWEVLRTANETVEERLYVGMTGEEAHDLALDVLAEGGYRDRMGHSLGHGVGLQIHELPLLSPRNREPLVSGNVVTVEPGIYISGSFGMRLEDCGILTKDGYKRFGTCTHNLIVV